MAAKTQFGTHIFRGVCLSLFIVSVTGCAATQPADAGPYQAEFDQLLADSPSGFQHDILSDYRITEQEYAEARERFLACLTGAGVRAELLPEGGYTIHGAVTARVERIDIDCANENLMLIEPLYTMIRDNPGNRSYFALARECLQEAGVIGGETTEEAIEKLFTEASATAVDGVSGLTLPSGVSFDAPEVTRCLLVAGGVTE